MHVDVTVRTDIRPGDLGKLIALHGWLYADEYGWDATFEAYVAQALAELTLPPNRDRSRLWLVERGGHVAGSIAILGRERQEAQLRCFLLRPDCRGIGLGHSLLDTALAFSRKFGHRSVYLWTVSDLTAAARLYMSAGFTKTQEVTHELWGATITEERYELVLTETES